MEECQFFIDKKSFLDGGMSIFFTVIHMGPGTTMTNATPSARPAMFGFVDVFFSISTSATSATYATCCVIFSIITIHHTRKMISCSILYFLNSSIVSN